MNQPALFHEDVYGALGEVIAACGGRKVVGAKVFPEKSPESAARLLADCLNPDRPEKLDPEQLLLILRMGRERGCHAAMNFIAGDVGYQATAIEPDDERAALQRQFIEATKAMQALSARMERAGLLRAA